MNYKKTTKPLSWKEIKKALLLLENEGKYHFLQIIAVGVFTGYRISDMRELKYSDFDNDYLNIEERKTSKQRIVKIVPELKRIVQLCQIKLYRKEEHFLFVRTRFFVNQPISKVSFIARIKKALNYAGVDGNRLSGHTLRKTFALRYYQLMSETEGDYRALSELSKQLNHSNTDVTRRYIGIEEKVIQNVFKNFY